MSVTAAPGFAATGVSAGIRPSGKPDVALIRSLGPAVGCAMWTRNRVQAAPVTVSRRHLELAEPQAVVVNAGVANAATGIPGEQDARATAERVAERLGIRPEEVVVLSTGVIGPRLPMEKLLAGVDSAAAALSQGGGDAAAQAILTTDNGPKTAVVSQDGFTIGGMAKGAGMIHPSLATMLAVVTTDYPLASRSDADRFLRPAVERSFNRISVDGDCSTNDAVVLLAPRGDGGGDAALDSAFAEALEVVCRDLARQIVADGEGATVVLEIGVSGASSSEEAHAIARRVATSPLVKTAAFGHDPNWGRVLAAAGLRAVERRVRASRPRQAVGLVRRDDGVRDRVADGARPGPRRRSLPDRARPRARRRRGCLPCLGPLDRLREAERGVHDVSGGPVVLKLGGRVAAGAVRAALAGVDGPVVVVHGGGPQITAEMERRGIEPSFVGGRRVTTPAVLDVVRDSLAVVNAELCAAIGPDAVGLSGDEIGLEARQVEELGLVGDPSPSAPAAVVEALAAGRVPVVSPLAAGPLNVNADEAAAALAVGLRASRIVFLTDVPGVLLDGELTAVLPADEAEAGVADGRFEGGIVPKLLAAARAARGGVRASIGATEVPA